MTHISLTEILRGSPEYLPPPPPLDSYRRLETTRPNLTMVDFEVFSAILDIEQAGTPEITEAKLKSSIAIVKTYNSNSAVANHLLSLAVAAERMVTRASALTALEECPLDEINSELLLENYFSVVQNGTFLTGQPASARAIATSIAALKAVNSEKRIAARLVAMVDDKLYDSPPPNVIEALKGCSNVEVIGMLMRNVEAITQNRAVSKKPHNIWAERHHSALDSHHHCPAEILMVADVPGAREIVYEAVESLFDCLGYSKQFYSALRIDPSPRAQAALAKAVFTLKPFPPNEREAAANALKESLMQWPNTEVQDQLRSVVEGSPFRATRTLFRINGASPSVSLGKAIVCSISKAFPQIPFVRRMAEISLLGRS